MKRIKTQPYSNRIQFFQYQISVINRVSGGYGLAIIDGKKIIQDKRRYGNPTEAFESGKKIILTRHPVIVKFYQFNIHLQPLITGYKVIINQENYVSWKETPAVTGKTFETALENAKSWIKERNLDIFLKECK